MSGTIYVQQQGSTWLADVAELPGCVARGATRDEAVAKARASFDDYKALLARRGVSTEHWRGLDPSTFTVKDAPERGEALPEDTNPLAEHELRDFLHRLEASRAELLALVRGIDAERMERAPREGMWSVRQALEHIATTEITLLDKLEKWPAGDFATLQAVHRMIVQRFSVMEPEDTGIDHRIQGRRWTTRRIMRRLLEHEYEHLGHIKEILAAL